MASVKLSRKLIFILLFLLVILIISKHRKHNPVDDSETVNTNIEHLGLNKEYVAKKYCFVNCTVGIPCEYADELDFRIIVITYNRPDSLEQCLNNVGELHTEGDRLGVDIWIDRNRDGHTDNKTVHIARAFAESWTKGRACVHIQNQNAGIRGQWIDTWRPKPNTNEMTLILEDDIDLSPQAYRWLKMVKMHFRDNPDIDGYCLQMENVQTKAGRIRPLHGPATDVVFLYEQFCTWGFAPVPEFWRKFQVWYHKQHQVPDFQPFVPNIISTKWYKDSIKAGKVNNSWELWFTFFKYVHSKFTVYSNLLTYTGRSDVLLDTNRRESGLHFGPKSKVNHGQYLLQSWNKSFEVFPKQLQRYGFDGRPIPNSSYFQ